MSQRTPATPPTHEPQTRARRRLTKLGLTIIFVLAITVSLVLVQILGSRLSKRFDVTALGVLHLTPRTLEVLDQLSGDYRIVLAGPWSDARRALGLDPRVVTQVFDVLEEIDRASEHVELVRIDTLSARGIGNYQQLIDELIARDQDAIDELTEAQQRVRTGIEQAADTLEQLGARLRNATQLAPAGGQAGQALREQLGSWASLSRLLAGEVRQQAADAHALAQSPIGSTPVMALDEARRVLDAAVDRLDGELTGFADVLRDQSEHPATPGMLADALAPMARSLNALRDDLAIRRDALARVATPDAVRIARVLGATNAALIVGPASVGTTAISFDALFPSINPLRENLGIHADLRLHTENIATIALASLTAPDPPIVVLVHGEGQRFILKRGVMNWVRQRLELRGVTLVEWASVLDPDPPSLTQIDPTGRRPVVYVAMGTDDSSSTDGRDPLLAGPARALTLGRAIGRIVDRGDPLLLCVAPSTAPSWGGTDATTVVLALFGLEADSGRPVLTAVRTAQGRQVSPDFRLRSDEGVEHPIARAIAGLPTQLTWPIPIHQIEPTGRTSRVTRVELLLVLDEEAWAESQWQVFRKTPRGERVGIPLPEPTPDQDDLDGPWAIAVAAEREAAGLDRPQRLLVVGSNLWFVDSQTREPALVDGRTVMRNPGNAELFETAIWWLAGQDELIAQGPTTRPVALIRALSGGEQAAILWGLFAGLPLMILLAGLIWRLVRG